MIMSSKLRWVWHIACLWQVRNAYKIFFFQNLKGRDNFGDIGGNEKIILKWIIKNRVWRFICIQLVQDAVHWRAFSFYENMKFLNRVIITIKVTRTNLQHWLYNDDNSNSNNNNRNNNKSNLNNSNNISNVDHSSRSVLSQSNIGITGFNLARGVDVLCGVVCCAFLCRVRKTKNVVQNNSTPDRETCLGPPTSSVNGSINMYLYER